MSISSMPPVERVLVVDDDSQSRDLLEAHLIEAGYAVLLASSGEEALRAFETRPTDLVLLDVMMPGLDGFDTCARLRRLPGGADVAVVFVTALSDAATHHRAQLAGADDFLAKPVGRAELLVRVRSLLRIRRLTRELERAHLLVHDLGDPLSALVSQARHLASLTELGHEPRAAVDGVLRAADSLQRTLSSLRDVN